MVRARFYVSSVELFGHGTTVNLSPVYSPDESHPNKAFWDATPTGSIEMYIKTDAAQYFEVGQEYDIVFERVPEEA